MTRTKKISRWVNIYPDYVGTHHENVEMALNNKLHGCLATMELTGSYTLPERKKMLSEDEIRAAFMYSLNPNEMILELFGDE